MQTSSQDSEAEDVGGVHVENDEGGDKQNPWRSEEDGEHYSRLTRIAQMVYIRSTALVQISNK